MRDPSRTTGLSWTVRQDVRLISPVSAVPQMLAMMVDLEDDDEWAMADELEDDDFDR